jgi:hypothetical protein
MWEFLNSVQRRAGGDKCLGMYNGNRIRTLSWVKEALFRPLVKGWRVLMKCIDRVNRPELTWALPRSKDGNGNCSCWHSDARFAVTTCSGSEATHHVIPWRGIHANTHVMSVIIDLQGQKDKFQHTKNSHRTGSGITNPYIMMSYSVGPLLTAGIPLQLW